MFVFNVNARVPRNRKLFQYCFNTRIQKVPYNLALRKICMNAKQTILVCTRMYLGPNMKVSQV